MFGGLGIWELIFIFLVVLLLFGAKRLPEIGASLGKGIREFKGSLSEIEKEIKAPGGESASRDRTVEPGEEEAGPRRLRSDGGPTSTPSRPAPETEKVGGEGRPMEDGGTEG